MKALLFDANKAGVASRGTRPSKLSGHFAAGNIAAPTAWKAKMVIKPEGERKPIAKMDTFAKDLGSLENAESHPYWKMSHMMIIKRSSKCIEKEDGRRYQYQSPDPDSPSSKW